MQPVATRSYDVSESDDVVFRVFDSPMLEMPNGAFRDSFMVTDRTGNGKRLSAGLGWFSPHYDGGHVFAHGFDEVFYIVRGEARFVADGALHDVRSGDVVYCRAGVAHTFVTAGAGLQIFWCISGGWEEMSKELREEMARTWLPVDPRSGWHLEI
jgi:mannose-6-phosphate isomerase-like protein (cupin superfamily)